MLACSGTGSGRVGRHEIKYRAAVICVITEVTVSFPLVRVLTSNERVDTFLYYSDADHYSVRGTLCEVQSAVRHGTAASWKHHSHPVNHGRALTIDNVLRCNV